MSHNSTTVYSQQGASFYPSKLVHDATPPLTKLPAGNYMVGFHPKHGFHVKVTDDFSLPKKIYGNAIATASKIVNTFQNRSSNTGTMLVGDKGSGKSLTAKAVCLLMKDLGHPTIIITENFLADPYPPDQFLDFLSNINQPCAIFLDEFEKTFDVEDQRAWLTILDGVFQSKKLFLLTSNSQYAVDSNLNNRPGRLYYWLSYEGLDKDTVREFCADRLKDPAKAEEVIKVLGVFQSQLNFDMLQALVEEVNLYPADKVASHLKFLNIRPDLIEDENFNMTVTIGGHDFMSREELVSGSTWRGDPFQLGEFFSVPIYNTVLKLHGLPATDKKDVVSPGLSPTGSVEVSSLRARRKGQAVGMGIGDLLDSLAESRPKSTVYNNKPVYTEEDELVDSGAFTRFKFTDSDRIFADPEAGFFKFQNGQGQVLTLSRRMVAVSGIHRYLDV